MPLLFVWENLHFGSHLFAGLTLLACFWLYFDAMLASGPSTGSRSAGRHGWTTVGLLGWATLALSFFLSAVDVESPVLPGVLEQLIFDMVAPLMRLIGYGLLAGAILLEPLPARPEAVPSLAPTPPQPTTLSSFPVAWLLWAPRVVFLLPLAAWVVAYGYWRRATAGLERHLKPLALGFLLLAVYQVAALTRLLRATTNPTLFRLVTPFGVFWLLEHVVLVVAITVLMVWVAKYLLRRFQTELFMIFVSMSVGIFLVITVTFSSYLLRFTQAATLERLSADAKTFGFLLERTEQALLSDAQLVAGHQLVRQYFADPKHAVDLGGLARDILLTSQDSTLVITDADGQVLARGENPELTGTSLSDDPLVKRARAGEAVSGVVVTEGATAPALSAAAAVPIKDGERVIGTVLVGTRLDTAYVDGLKAATGLDAAFYAGEVLSASTITGYNSSMRWIGTKNTNQAVTDQVLQRGEAASGTVTLLSTPYLAAYIPLTAVGGETVGMLLVGTPQITLLATAARSLQFTFGTSVILMLFSFIPSWWFARRLARQVQ